MLIDQQGRLSSIETLRGLAALAVVWFHLTKLYTGGPVQASGSYGRLGVEAFFVISGFVIPYSLHRAGYCPAQFFRYLARRAMRIEPPYLLSVAIVVALWHLSALTPGFRGEQPHFEFGQIVAHLCYAIPFTQYKWLNLVYWTLAYEAGFYVVAGLCFPFIARAKTPVFSATFAAAFIALSILYRPPIMLLFFLIGTAGFRHFIGVDGRASFILMAGAAVAVLVFLGEPAMAFVGAATIVLILFVEIPEIAPLLFLGEISYSLYLLHSPIGGRVINLGARFTQGAVTELALSLLATCVSISAAWIFWKYIEQPSRNMARRLTLNQRTGHETGPLTTEIATLR